MPLNNPKQIQVKSGTYTGNSTTNRAVPHGLPGKPKAVFICNQDSYLFYRIFGTYAGVYFADSSGNGVRGVTAMDGTNFYVGNATNYFQSANYTGETYHWFAVFSND